MVKISVSFGYPSWELASLAKLNSELQEILNAPPTPESPSRCRDRYTKAFLALSQFFRNQNFNPAVANEFLELASAFRELGHGTSRHFLKPEKPSNRRLDSADIWSARAFVAIALDFLVVQERISTRDAAKKLRDLAGGLVAFFPTAKDFAGAARGWHKVLKGGTCSSARAVKLFNERHKLVEEVIADIAAKGESATLDAVVEDILQTALIIAAQAADGETISTVRQRLLQTGI